jgi:hypothetical protein
MPQTGDLWLAQTGDLWLAQTGDSDAGGLCFDAVPGDPEAAAHGPRILPGEAETMAGLAEEGIR